MLQTTLVVAIRQPAEETPYLKLTLLGLLKKKTNYGIRQQKHYYIVGRKWYPWVCLGTEELDSIHDGVPMR
jgi:hypothetical protein